MQQFYLLKSNDVREFQGGSQGAALSMIPANLGLCPPLLQTCEKSS